MSTHSFPSPVTAEQRLALMRERARYESHQHLTPNNETSAHVHDQLEQQRETQINHIDERLHDAHDRLQKDRAFAVHEGRAVAEFNQASHQHPSPSNGFSHDTGHER